MAIKALNSIAGFSVGEIPANIILANGDITTSNITSTVAFIGSLTGNASGSAATVTTNAQPNITSVGTLTSLTVSGNLSTANLVVTTSVGGNLIPTANITYDLGNATNRWKDLYLASSTIYLGAEGTISSGDLTAGYDYFANDEEIDVNIIVDAHVIDDAALTVIQKYIIGICESRKDCVGIFQTTTFLLRNL